MATVTQLGRVKWDLNLSLGGATLIIPILHFSFPMVSKRPRGLPWWFVVVGWLLVAATSGVAAFFTMLYGLHYGRASSLKWLISMAVSFVESVFVTQPLKVRLPWTPPPTLSLLPASLSLGSAVLCLFLTNIHSTLLERWCW